MGALFGSIDLPSLLTPNILSIKIYIYKNIIGVDCLKTKPDKKCKNRIRSGFKLEDLEEGRHSSPVFLQMVQPSACIYHLRYL
jgi:hypothetical protein